MDVTVHEMGHSIFALADEYDHGAIDEGEDDTYGGSEPNPVNVTTQADPALVKWNAHATAGSASPTMPNPDRTTANDGASPVAADVVGTFEGPRPIGAASPAAPEPPDARRGPPHLLPGLPGRDQACGGPPTPPCPSRAR